MKRLLTATLLLLMLLPGVARAQETADQPQVIDLAASEVPADIQFAIAAVLQRLRGLDTPIEGATYDPAGRHHVGESGFNYEGYDATGIAITGYTATMLDSGKASVILEGMMLFKDLLMRRTGVYFCAQYLADRNGILIQKSVTTGMAPAFPRVETYIIEEDALRSGMENMSTYQDYYLHVLENAEPMTYAPGGDSSGSREKYFIVTFCKDRIFEESDLKMEVTDKQPPKGKDVAKPVYLNDSGWRFMIAGGKFRPGSRSCKFHVTVTYKQDPKSYLPETVVGQFENVKEEFVLNEADYAAQPASASAPQQAPATAPVPAPVPAPIPQPAPVPAPIPQPAPVPVPQPQASPQPAPTPAPAPATAPAMEGPLATGSAFLNPIFPEDVTLIQKRLQALGFYNGPIDMEFGPLTKKGLDRFAVRNGFPPGQWSLGLQKKLFRGTGL